MWAKLVAFVKSHQAVALDLGKFLLSNPALLPELVTVAEGGSPLAFAQAHPDVVAALLNQINAAVQADPSLIPAILTAVA